MNSNQTAKTAPTGPFDPSGWALVVDDHPLFCDALELTLRSIARFNEIKTADCLEAAIQLIEAGSHPSIILLDLNLPDVSGLDGLIRLKRIAQNTPVIIVSSMTDNATIGGAIVAGASGFVPKHSPRSVFQEAIEHIERGDVFKPAGYVQSSGTS